jgi:uncharacterized membrane protein
MFGHRQAIDDEPVYSSGDALIKLLSLIPVMSKWNWVSEGFSWESFLCMVIHGPFQRQFQR